jgi:transcriptional regulator with XRE-family HTH domain
MGNTPVPNHHGRRLTRELRKAREAAGLTQGEAGERGHFNLQKVSRFETGQVPSYHEMHALLEAYGIPYSERTLYDELYKLARVKGWWHGLGLFDTAYLSAEHEASALFEFRLGHLPDLLQTEDYARALAERTMRAPEGLPPETRVEIVLLRQERLSGAEKPLAVRTIVDETALWQGAGRAQLAHIAQCVERLTNLTFQVLPHETGLHAGMFGSMIILGYDDPDEEDQAFVPNVFGEYQRALGNGAYQIGQALACLSDMAMSPDDSVRLLKKLHKSTPS